MLIIHQSSCSASKQQNASAHVGEEIRIHCFLSAMKGKIKKKQQKSIKLSSFPSWMPVFHLPYWIFQPEKRNILKNLQTTKSFSMPCLWTSTAPVPSLLPTKTAPPPFHPISCWQEMWRNSWSIQQSTGQHSLPPQCSWHSQHLLKSSFSHQWHAVHLTSEPW